MTRRIAIIGLGGIAQKAYLPLLTAREDVQLLVHSRREDVVQETLRRYRLASGSTDFGKVLRWSPQAAFLLTPSPTHYDLAKALLEGGIDVFVEKPLTLHSQQALELSRLAEAKGRVLMVGFNRRFAPLHQQALRLWGGRAIGLCLLQKHRPDAAHDTLFGNYIDDTIHQIDLLRYYCGEATALVTHYRRQAGRMTNAISIARLAAGGFACILTSLQAGRWSETYTLHGDQATLHISAFLEARLHTSQDERVLRVDPMASWTPSLEIRGFAHEIDHFLECVDARAQPSTSGQEAWKTQLLLEEMVERGVDDGATSD